MKNLKLDRRMAQLVLLQRIELANPFLTKLRKTFENKYLPNIFLNFDKKGLANSIL